MAYKVIILYRLYMPSYFLGTFAEYPTIKACNIKNEAGLYAIYFIPLALKIRSLASLMRCSFSSAAFRMSSPNVATRSG